MTTNSQAQIDYRRSIERASAHLLQVAGYLKGVADVGGTLGCIPNLTSVDVETMQQIEGDLRRVAEFIGVDAMPVKS